MKYNVVKFHISVQKNTDVNLSVAQDVLCALAADIGFESFENCSDGVNGYIQCTMFDQTSLDALLADFPINDIDISYQVSEMPDEDWNAAWEAEGFQPIAIANRCIIHDIHHLPDEMDFPIDITIDARQAFGTGTHETTRMMVMLLLEQHLEGKCVLDCGCGTGILSLVAAKAGALSVTGYDIDEWSVENTRHNAELNGVGNIDVLLGDVNVLSHINGLFNIVMANINRNVLLSDLPKIKEALSDDGVMLLSGFFMSDSMVIAKRAGEFGLSLVDTKEENGWCAMAFKA